MGNLYSADYETPEVIDHDPRSSALQTGIGGVEHNERNSLLAGPVRATQLAADMANDLLTQPRTESGTAAGTSTGRELEAFLGKA